MDFDLKLKALQKLIHMESKSSKEAIEEAFLSAKLILEKDKSYEKLEKSLRIIKIIGASKTKDTLAILSAFLLEIENRNLEYDSEATLYNRDYSNFYNSNYLTVLVIEALSNLRYLETEKVFELLLKLTNHESERVRKKSSSALNELAEYNIDVYYGNETYGGIGASPQLTIINHIKKYDCEIINSFFTKIIDVINCLVATEIKGISSTYNTVTFKSAKIPNHEQLHNVRNLSIETLKCMFSCANSNNKLLVIDTLYNCTRFYAFDDNKEENESFFLKQTLQVINFYKEAVISCELSIVEKIEHHAYWIFFHSNKSEIKNAALELKEIISGNNEYIIFKTLIGFEGIHHDWISSKEETSFFEKEDEYRKNKADEYANKINDENSQEWKKRIISYAQIKSNDLATFPIFYYFLEKVTLQAPDLMLSLLEEHSNLLENFMSTITKNLRLTKKKDETLKLMNKWCDEGKYLNQSIAQYIENPNIDHAFLEKLLDKAKSENNLHALSLILVVVVSNHENENSEELIKKYFLPSLKFINKKKYTSWIYDFWFRRKAKVLFKSRNEELIDLVLENLLELKTIEYQAEEILYQIALEFPEKILVFFLNRIEKDLVDKKIEEYTPIPFKFYKLDKPLSVIPEFAVLKTYDSYKKDSYLFRFRGAMLLSNIFEQCPEVFFKELLFLSEDEKETGIDFTLDILRNYNGNTFVYPICKEIVKLLPSNKKSYCKIATVLDSMGVVSGEYGVADSYKEKRNLVVEWLEDKDGNVQKFAKWYVDSLDSQIEMEMRRVDEEIQLRKHKYGE